MRGSVGMAVKADAACHHVFGCRQRTVELDVAVGYNTTAAGHRKAALAGDQPLDLDVSCEKCVRRVNRH